MQETIGTGLTPSEGLPGLKTRTFGRVYHYLPELVSTNAMARELALQGSPEGTLVVAGSQSGGRGRLGRSWASPPGGLWLSLLLRPSLEPARAPLQTLLAAVALRESLAAAGLEAAIKWPNDLLARGKKVAGILAEMGGGSGDSRFLVVGVGINANFPADRLPEPLRLKAGTFQDLLGRPLERPRFLAVFLETWEDCYDRAAREGYGDILERWRRGSLTLGKKVCLDTGSGLVVGRALDIDARGGLVLETERGRTRTFLAGEVTLLEG
jgi:BirA family transcriptional regulator, biotin operon repressor / biotin---[acetyl-CoA-carboxylase] ligase